ncbi:MAG: hypothetical protein ACFCU4_05915 [Puniceicoccaceae bacterium]
MIVQNLKENFFKWLILGSLVTHLVLLIALRPVAKTTLGFDSEAEKERVAQVNEREAQRREMEHQRRQKIRLPKDQARELMAREEVKRKDILRENVLRLRAVRDKVELERREALEEFSKRTQRDILPHQLERLREALAKMSSGVHQLEREPILGEEPTELKAKVDEMLRAVTDLKKQAESTDPEKADQEFQARAAEIEKMAEKQAERFQEWKDQYDGSTSFRASGAQRFAEAVQKQAAALKDGIDLEAFNASPIDEPFDPPPPASSPEGAAVASSADLYNAAQDLENQIIEAERHTQAAELATAQGSTFDDGLKRLSGNQPNRPDLGPALAAASSESSSSTTGDQIDSAHSGQSTEAADLTVGALNEFREAIASAVSETNDMRRRAERMIGQSSPIQRPDPSRRTAQEESSRHSRSNTLVDMRPFQSHNFEGGGRGAESYDMGLRSDGSGLGSEMLRGSGGRTLLSQNVAKANALPGRMLTDNAIRQGFLFLDTWYIIGPWDNWSRANFEVVHPPEQKIDLDAVYLDGKFANSPNHPYHRLRWEFVQSDRIAIEPPFPTYSATYYAYTEVYSDTWRDMLVSVGSDDMAKVWLNGDVIWTDVGQSSWNLNEGYRKVTFRKGFNTVLVRLENGPAYTAFSVLLTPPEALQQDL